MHLNVTCRAFARRSKGQCLPVLRASFLGSNAQRAGILLNIMLFAGNYRLP